MTNSDSNIEKMVRYRAAAMGAQLAQAGEDFDYVTGSLEHLAEDFGVAGEGVDLMRAMATKEATLQALEIYSSKYSKARDKITIKELSEGYGNTLKDFLDYEEDSENNERYDAVMAKFNEVGDKSFGELAKAVIKAQTQLKNAEVLGLSDSEKNEAKKVMEKYQVVMNDATLIEAEYLDEIKSKIYTRVRKRKVQESSGIEDDDDDESEDLE